MTLREKYDHAIQTAKGFRMQGSAEERDGKLYFKGLVKNQDEVNKIWDAIKTVPDWRNDIVGKIAKEHLGDANAYMKIFEANKDQLSDPDKIKPGQVLKIPAAA